MGLLGLSSKMNRLPTFMLKQFEPRSWRPERQMISQVTPQPLEKSIFFVINKFILTTKENYKKYRTHLIRMTKRYYFDTSIWLDFFEYRDEPNLPKGKWAHELLNKVVKEDNKILYSDLNLIELGMAGYSVFEIEEMFRPLRLILIMVESTEKQQGKARDLSAKRDVPKGDALHALIARDNKAILVTRDKHFQKLLDITIPKKPEELI